MPTESTAQQLSFDWALLEYYLQTEKLESKHTAS